MKLKSDVGVLPSALPGKQHNPVSRRLKALLKALRERNPAEAAKPLPRYCLLNILLLMLLPAFHMPTLSLPPVRDPAGCGA